MAFLPPRSEWLGGVLRLRFKKPRRVCSWCGLDMGPAGPEYQGDTHGMCEECLAAELGKIHARPTDAGREAARRVGVVGVQRSEGGKK